MSASVPRWEYELMRAPKPEYTKTFGAYLLTGVMAIIFAVAVAITQPGCSSTTLAVANSALASSAQVESAASGVMSFSCSEEKRAQSSLLDEYCSELGQALEAYSAARGALAAAVSIAEASEGPINGPDIADAVANLTRASTRVYEAMSKISGFKQ